MTMTTDVNRRSPVRAHIAPGERLLWLGRAGRGVRLHSVDMFHIPFSILWAFAVLSIIRSESGDGLGPPLLFFLPFGLMAFHVVVGRFVWDAYRRRHTHYAVTDERVLILAGVWSRRLTSIPLRTISEITREGGSLRFGPPNPLEWFVAGSWPGAKTGPSFEHIEDAAAVSELVRQAQLKAL